MFNVIACIVTYHDLKLVVLALALCISGVAVSLKLHGRTLGTHGGQSLGWGFLTAVSAGSSIWSTHFVAMLGYRPNAAVTFDPLLTIASLFIAIIGTAIGIHVAAMKRPRLAPAIGGAIIGLAISAMHFTGMFAYKVDGIIEWNPGYIAASLAVAVVFSALAFDSFIRFPATNGFLLASAFLCISIVGLHFSAMTAFSVVPMSLGDGMINQAAFEAMALSIALACLIIAGAGFSSYLIDNLNRLESTDQIRYLALHDQLTGLPNRASYNRYVDQQLSEAWTLKVSVAVIAIDLDRFKEINDAWGHTTGDKALEMIGARLQTLVDGHQYVARIGGDEFAAVRTYESEADLQGFLGAIAEAIEQPIRIDGIELAVGSCIGVAVFPRDAKTRQALANNADLAMYKAKADALNICFYDQEMGEAVRQRRAQLEDLRNAIEAGQLTVHYMVQASIQTGEILGYEALLRWTHPTLGPVSPAAFIPLAEEHGLILSIGEWVLRQACADAVGWNQSYKVAVNVSAVQINQPDFPGQVHRILLQTGLPAARLEIELTETALIKDKSRSLNVIRRIKALGVSIAIDDFGVGYSSLETLRMFPFDKIKLDRFFIVSITRDQQCLAIVRAVLALGKSLGIPILAEGIETQEQLAILAFEGCDLGQGYLLGRAGPNSEVTLSGGRLATISDFTGRTRAKPPVANGPAPQRLRRTWNVKR